MKVIGVISDISRSNNPIISPPLDRSDIFHDARIVFMDGFKISLKYNAFEDSYGVSHMMHILFLINALQEGEV